MSRLARLRFLRCGALAVRCCSARARAGRRPRDPPAHISFVDGAAVLERDGRSETAPASMPLLAGDRVRTQDGRVEILFADGSTLHLDADTRRRLPVRRSGSAARRPRATEHRRPANRARRLPRRCAVGLGADHDARRVSHRGRSTRRRESSSRCCAAGGARQRRRAHGARRRRARVRARRRAPVAAVRLQLRGVGCLRSLVGEPARRRASASSSQYLPDTVQPYAATFNQLRLLAERSPPTATCGIRACGPAGGRTTTDAGRRCGRGDGRGLAPIRGRGRRTTTDAGDSRRARGSGFPGGPGARRGSRGATRPAT